MTRHTKVSLPFLLVMRLGRIIGGKFVLFSRYDCHPRAQPIVTNDSVNIAMMSEMTRRSNMSMYSFVEDGSSSKSLQSVAQPFLAARACDREANSSTNPAVNRKIPSQSTLLSARLSPTLRPLTPRMHMKNGKLAIPARTQNAARHLIRSARPMAKQQEGGQEQPDELFRDAELTVSRQPEARLHLSRRCCPMLCPIR